MIGVGHAKGLVEARRVSLAVASVLPAETAAGGGGGEVGGSANEAATARDEEEVRPVLGGGDSAGVGCASPPHAGLSQKK